MTKFHFYFLASLGFTILKSLSVGFWYWADFSLALVFSFFAIVWAFKNPISEL